MKLSDIAGLWEYLSEASKSAALKRWKRKKVKAERAETASLEGWRAARKQRKEALLGAGEGALSRLRKDWGK